MTIIKITFKKYKFVIYQQTINSTLYIILFVLLFLHKYKHKEEM